MSNGCWEWTAGLRGKTGYGCMKYDGRVQDGHRISWQIYRGKIPSGIFVCHVCDNRRCVNPEHLFLGTQKDNVQDAIKKNRFHFVPKEKQFPKGKIAENRKLTDKQVIDIRNRAKIGKINKYALGREFGVDEKAIRLLLKGETYWRI